MNMNQENNPIPLSDDLDWWWYKAKSNLLQDILKNYSEYNFDKILEIGPGKGNNIKILNKFGDVDVLDKEEFFIEYLKQNFSLNISEFYSDLDEINKKYDLIVLLDVLEHIDNDKKFMNTLKQYLNPKGIVIVGVPAYSSLWSIHDEKLQHYRRYTWRSLSITLANYDIIKRYGFNFILLPIRYLQIKISNNIHSVEESSRLVNKVLFSISLIERTLRRLNINPKIGISIYAVLKLKN